MKKLKAKNRTEVAFITSNLIRSIWACCENRFTAPWPWPHIGEARNLGLATIVTKVFNGVAIRQSGDISRTY